MNLTLELQGSEILRVEAVGQTLRLVFSAACVRRSAPILGGADDFGYLKAVEMTFAQARWQGEPLACFGRLSASRLWLDGAPHAQMALPLVAAGDIRAEFSFAAGPVLTLAASDVHCLCTGEARFFESFAC